MQRDSTARSADASENDARDTPLSRLLRKPGSAPEAPDSKSPSAQPAAAEPPVSRPLDTPVAGPAPTAARPPAPQLSPAEMLVSKLRGKQVPLPVHRPLRAQPSVPEALAGNPVDVEYTPVEAATSEPSDLQGTAPEAPAAEPPQVSASQAPVAKPLGMQGMALETALNRPLWKPEPVPAVTVARPQGAQTPAPEPTIDTPLPKPEAMPAMPAAGRQSAQESAPETIDTPLPRPEPMSESPAKPEGAQGSALGTAVGKLLRRQDAEPEARVSEPRPTQVAAAGKSVGKLLRLPRRTRDEREFLPAALEIVDTPPSPVGRAVGLTIIALAVIAIAWACIGRVDIVATASGRIVPQGKTKIVQPADTGIVTAIHVADNDHVKAGDVLIELNSIQSLADRDRFARDLLQANLNLARLRGLAATLPGTKGEGREPDLVDPPKAAKPEDIALTLAAMRAQATNESAKLADLDQQIEAKQAEAAEAEASAEKLQASLPMLADQEQLLRTMRDQKIGSKLDWYQVNQQLIEQQHEIGVLSHRKDAAAAAQRALKEQRQAEATQFQMQVLSELDKARTQASELEAELAKAEQRLRQGVLHAPIDGTVQQLAIHTIGGVVTPAEALLAIVPDDDSLVVEAAVQNRDVGFIRAGQTVRVKVEAFNFTLYGLIDGKVLDVTRDTVSHPANDKKSKDNNQDDGDGVASDQSGPVYLARIALAQDWMMTENGKVNLTPGMAVTAEIQTGERRLISYLLSPLTRHVSESMHER